MRERWNSRAWTGARTRVRADPVAKNTITGAITALFYVGALALIMLWALTEHNPLMRRGIVLALVGAASLVLPVLAFGFRRLPRLVFQIVLPITTLAIAGAIVASGQITPVAFLLLWPVPYVVALYTPRQTVVQMALLAVGYAAALMGVQARTGHSFAPTIEDVIQWVFLMMTVVAISAFVLRMRGALRASSARLHQRAAQQAAVSDLGASALSDLDIAPLFEEAVELVHTTLSLDFTTVLESLPGGTEMVMRAGRGWPKEALGREIVPLDHRSQAAHTLSGDGPLVVEDYRTETRFEGAEILHAYGIRSAATVPIAGRSSPFGILAANTKEQRTFSQDDMNFLQSIANVLAAAIERRIAEDETRHQALHDPLTGLPNRLLFRDRLQHALVRSRREGSPLAVMFVDVDDFKLINDRSGHEAGDGVLVELAARLSVAVRSGDTVARHGGDEFVLLCEGIADEAEAIEIAERVRGGIALPFPIGGGEQLISASVGVALRTPTTDGPDELIRDADAAMYHAKQRGRARYEVFNPSMHHGALERLRIESELRDGIERGEMRLHYQPVIDLHTGDIGAVEALVRWQHPTRGLLAPGEFIPVAEESGLIVPLGKWVLREAARMARHWLEMRPGPPTWLVVSVNLSARQMMEPDLVSTVAEALRDARVDPRLLALEITETLLVEDPLASAETLSALRALGVKLVLDDFGTGYSSLGYVKHFPLDYLKLDRSFVRGRDPRGRKGDGDRERGRRDVARARRPGAGRGCGDRGSARSGDGARLRLRTGFLLLASDARRADRRAAPGGAMANDERRGRGARAGAGGSALARAASRQFAVRRLRRLQLATEGRLGLSRTCGSRANCQLPTANCEPRPTPQ